MKKRRSDLVTEFICEKIKLKSFERAREPKPIKLIKPKKAKVP